MQQPDNPYLEVKGARVHNLKNIDVRIPRNQLIVLTGISGSGKSSLAFDTIYTEGQRRYIESFASYARNFLGNMERPDVDQITGLSPVISIEQKTTNKNPRSTVGTITEIYDFLRLLYARASDAYSYHTGKKMMKFSESEIIEQIIQGYQNQKIILLAPLVRGRKGHYRELFDRVRKQGFLKIRVDGVVLELKEKMQLDRYKIHDIELVVDRLVAEEGVEDRLRKSVQKTLKAGDGLMMVLNSETQEIKMFSQHLMCLDTGLSYEEPSPNTFSFNSPYGACPHCKGLGIVHHIDVNLIIPDASKSINEGGLAPLGEYKENYIFRELRKWSKQKHFNLSKPISELSTPVLNFILFGNEEGKSIIQDQPLEISNGYSLEPGEGDGRFEGIVPMLKQYLGSEQSESLRKWAEEFAEYQTCPECLGSRLKKESHYFKVCGKAISEISQMNLNALAAWIEALPEQMDERTGTIAKDILKEIRLRTGFLLDVGLEYLSLDRPSRSLSGGESQRIRLATQIGSMLQGITYIMDEPSIGLHQRDNERLIQSLRKLTDVGNTVIVVEHDKDIMLASDYIIDLGPGAGKLGGHIVAEGVPKDFLNQTSFTSDYLSGRKNIQIPEQRRVPGDKQLVLLGAKGHNLKDVDITIPLGLLICITGVSGSGKSSLINETLYPIIRHHLYGSRQKALPYQSIEGLNYIDKVIEIDQSPIGRTPRSNPATYISVFSEIRALYAQLPEAKIRGYKPGRFSFNVKGGRCETCQGGGMRVIEMNFLPDVYVECESCLGKRYNRETLDVRFKGKSISDVLNMTISEAVVFFESIPSIHRKIATLEEVGLGYITLGQSAVTLSGGEAQRVKLSSELSKKDTGNTLYILDEPTTGLHFEDIRMLLEVLQKLVDRNNTVLIIEHNLDVIKVADYIIDMGPEGGEGGGRIVAKGTPEEVAASTKSHTARFLRQELSLVSG